MAKKTVPMIIGTILLATTILVGLLFFAPPLPNQRDNGFNRKWLNSDLQLLKYQETAIPIDNICGTTEDLVFISTNNPRCLIKTDYNLRKFDSIFFPVELSKTVMSNRQFNIIDSTAYLFINNQPGFIFGEIGTFTIHSPIFTPTKQIFTQCASISPSTAVIRTFDSLQTKQVFQKIYAPSGHVTVEEAIFMQQNDRGLGSDGLLRFDNEKKQLVYVQFYQNKVTVLDTNLLIIRQFNTIDTTFTNDTQIKEARISGQDKLVPTKARTIVNKKAFVTDGILYVQSGLRADNESIKDFKTNTAIDAYNIVSGKYIGSLYIPSQQDQRATSYIINKNKLIVLYKNAIAIFTFSLSELH